jgi:hypothetical protein
MPEMRITAKRLSADALRLFGQFRTLARRLLALRPLLGTTRPVCRSPPDSSLVASPRSRSRRVADCSGAKHQALRRSSSQAMLQSHSQACKRHRASVDADRYRDGGCGCI